MLYKQNPQEFANAFKPESLKRLQDYQTFAPYLPPDELTKKLNPIQDPVQMEAVKKVAAEGIRLASDPAPANAKNFIGPAQVLQAMQPDRPFWQSQITGGGKAQNSTDPVAVHSMMTDFYNLFGERYAVSGSADTAKAQAIDLLKGKYGTTSVGPGSPTLMAYPPERYNPVIGGSQDWMGKQLGEFVAKQYPDAQGYSVLSTPQTAADIAAKQPPSYNVGVIDKNGVFRLLTNPADGGQNVRFDPNKALTDSRSAFEAKRAATLGARSGGAWGAPQASSAAPAWGAPQVSTAPSWPSPAPAPPAGGKPARGAQPAPSGNPAAPPTATDRIFSE